MLPCLWPAAFQKTKKQAKAVEEFLLSVIGHNVEMIINAEAKECRNTKFEKWG